MRATTLLLAAMLAAASAPAARAASPPHGDVDDLLAALAASAASPSSAGIDPAATARRVRSPCGAGAGACVVGHCCSQRGTCGLAPWACGSTCQPEYSGRGSPCVGGAVVEPPPRAGLRVADPLAACGAYLATCPPAHCCTRLGHCALDGSGLCAPGSGCQPALSPTSAACAVNATAPPPVVRRHRLVAARATVAPDGFERGAVAVNGRTPGPTIVVGGAAADGGAAAAMTDPSVTTSAAACRTTLIVATSGRPPPPRGSRASRHRATRTDPTAR